MPIQTFGTNDEWKRRSEMLRAETVLMKKYAQFKTTQVLIMIDPVFWGHERYIKDYVMFLASAEKCFIEIVGYLEGSNSAQLAKMIDTIIKIRKDQE